MGIGPDLMQSARAAISGMIELLASRYNMRPVDAYLLCSVCADLHVSEIVDQPQLGGVALLSSRSVRVARAPTYCRALLSPWDRENSCLVPKREQPGRSKVLRRPSMTRPRPRDTASELHIG